MKLFKLLSLLVVTVFFSGAIHAQDKQAATQQLVNSGSFVFKAQTAIPSGSSPVTLATSYDLSITKDSIVAYLPYFGRAYTAAAAMGSGGIKFTSAKTGYKLKTTNKGGWDISFKPRDNREIQQIYLSVTPSGYATLQVLSTDRQPITFTGYIEKK